MATRILLKSEFAFFQSFSRLFLPTYFVKCRRILLNLNSNGPCPSSEREVKFLCCLFTFSIKREIRHFHVIVMQWRQRNIQKSTMQLNLLNLLVFLTFSLRSHRWILKSLICEGTIIHLLYLSLYGDSLRKQPTFGDTTTGFHAKWHLRNERWNSILMMRHYPDLGSAFDWFAHRWGGHILGWIKFPTRHDQSEALPRSE